MYWCNDMTDAARSGGRVVLAEGQPERRKPVAEPVPAHVALPVFEQLVQGWPEAFAARLKAAWALEVTPALRPLTTARLSTTAAALEGALIGLGRTEGHRLPVLVALCRHSVFGVTDRALGGPGRAAPEAALKRPVTPVEAQLARTVATHALESLSECLAPAVALPLTFSHWAQPSDGISDVRAGDAALVLSLHLPLPSGEGVLTLVLPLAVLEPLRPRLAATYPGQDFGADPAWRGHLARQVIQSVTPLAVVLGETTQSLAVLRALQPGDTIAFDLDENPLVSLMTGGVTVARGRLGRANGRVAFRFETKAKTGKEARK